MVMRGLWTGEISVRGGGLLPEDGDKHWAETGSFAWHKQSQDSSLSQYSLNILILPLLFPSSEIEYLVIDGGGKAISRSAVSTANRFCPGTFGVYFGPPRTTCDTKYFYKYLYWIFLPSYLGGRGDDKNNRRGFRILFNIAAIIFARIPENRCFPCKVVLINGGQDHHLHLNLNMTVCHLKKWRTDGHKQNK